MGGGDFDQNDRSQDGGLRYIADKSDPFFLPHVAKELQIEF